MPPVVRRRLENERPRAKLHRTARRSDEEARKADERGGDGARRQVDEVDTYARRGPGSGGCERHPGSGSWARSRIGFGGRRVARAARMARMSHGFARGFPRQKARGGGRRGACAGSPGHWGPDGRCGEEMRLGFTCEDGANEILHCKRRAPVPIRDQPGRSHFVTGAPLVPGTQMPLVLARRVHGSRIKPVLSNVEGSGMTGEDGISSGPPRRHQRPSWPRTAPPG